MTSVLETNEAEDAIQALGEFHESWLETTGRGRKRPREDAASAGGPMDPAVLNLGLDVDPTRLGGVTCQANKRLNRGGLGPSSASAEHPGITSTGMYPLEPLPQQAASASSSTSSSGLQLGHGNCSHLEDGTWAVPQTPEGWAQEFLTAVEQCGGSLPSPATQAEFQQRVLKLLHKYGDHHVVGVVGGGGQGGAQQGGLLSKYERLRNANQVLYRAISQMNDRMRRQQAELKTDLDHTAVRQKKYHEVLQIFSFMVFFTFFPPLYIWKETAQKARCPCHRSPGMC